MEELDFDELITTLTEDIANKRFKEAALRLDDLRPVDTADVIAHLDSAMAWRVLDLLPNRAKVFSYLESEEQVKISKDYPRSSLAKMISEMPSDERRGLFRHLDDTERQALLPALHQAEREDIRKLSSYEDGTAGSIMTSDYATLHKDMTAVQALEALRLEAPDAETIYHAYVIDKNRILLGVVSLRQLFVAAPTVTVEQLMLSNPIQNNVNDPQGDVAKNIARYDLIALPITDDNGAIVGIVTHDDAHDVFSDEVTEDIHRSGAVEGGVGNLKDATIGLLYSKRIYWLVFLVFGNLFSGAGIAHFEDIIAANFVLMFFLPLLIASGGNAGSQSSTLMVRALATGDVVMKDWFYLLGREVLVALCLGLTMALAISAIGYFRGDATVALVLALSMVSIVLIGCVIGMSLPFVLNRFGFDPASASAPLITSVCDVTGVLVYLAIATQFLSLT